MTITPIAPRHSCESTQLWENPPDLAQPRRKLQERQKIILSDPPIQIYKYTDIQMHDYTDSCIVVYLHRPRKDLQ